ncbi:MAG: ATP-binding cassette domain-containing protein, partial [Bacteroidales bacterium]|nr:ATP-binding cassette domain-containing protein [Bacteroidales bacterium]
MKNGSIITIENLVKSFPIGGGEFTALNGITLTFAKGEFSGIVGPSGSGKTTLLNILGSLDSPTKGQTNVLGTASGQMTPKVSATLRKKHIGFIFQTYNLMSVYTVFENVEFP